MEHHHYAVVRITPAMAKQWLDTNVSNNRKIIETLVNFYADEMKRGEWKVNGESIKLGKSGALLDGQHRLRAIIRSGVSVAMLVARDLDDSVFDTIDAGRRRGASDVISIAGYANSAACASIARWYLYITKSVLAGRPLSNHLIKETVELHPAIAVWATKHSNKAARIIFPSGCISVFVLLEEIHGSDLADDFFNKCCSGTNLSKGNPAWELRERLISARGNRSTYLKTTAAVCITIKAANAYLKGDKVGVLRYGSDETMPILVGASTNRELEVAF